MTSSDTASSIAQAVRAFFADHEAASLRLPSGWFGRPYDTFHRLSQAAAEGDHVLIRVDRTQVLLLDAQRVSSDGLVLRIAVRGGSWSWTDYGGDRRHEEVLGLGWVELHAPIRH